MNMISASLMLMVRVAAIYLMATVIAWDADPGHWGWFCRTVVFLWIGLLVLVFTRELSGALREPRGREDAGQRIIDHRP